MRLRSALFLMAGLAALSTGPVLAQSTQAPSDTAAKETRDPNEVVCEKQEVVGSRLATQKVCMTRAQWADLRKQDREAIERVQV